MPLTTSHDHGDSANHSDANDEFFMPDISEVLQGARKIIEGKKSRHTRNDSHDSSRHHNERVIDESTSVRVTRNRTGTIDEPFEVTVARKSVVRRPETDENLDQGWSSDSDVFGRPRISSIVRKCTHQRKTSLTDLSEIAERHENFVFRKSHKDGIWCCDTQPKRERCESEKSQSEDEAQIEVDFKEECHTEKGAHVVTQTWEVTWTVQNFHDLPDWMQDNEFLHTGHRPPLPDFVVCFRSILAWHTETGNIWTHLIGCVFFLFLMTYFWVAAGSHIQLQDKIIFSFFLVGAVLCLGMSAVFHTVSCHSKAIVHLFSRLDYTGISLLIVGSFIPWIYYGFYCRLWPKVSYITMIVCFGVAAVFVSLNKKFNDKKYRTLRALIFSTMGLSGIIPTIHFIYTDGMLRLLEQNSFYWLLGMAFLYLFGALLYATRTPERYFPGKCDFIGQSHQLFHVCVVMAAIVHYLGISEMAWNRLRDSCPGQNLGDSSSSHGNFLFGGTGQNSHSEL